MSYPAYAETKPSGVEWLGDVPKDWEVSRLKYVSAVTMGQSPPSDQYNLFGEGLPFLQGNAEFTNFSPVPKHHCTTAAKLSQPGDILLSIRAPVGAINVSDQVYGIGRGLCAITPTAAMDCRFLWHMLFHIREELAALSTGSTFDAVSVEEVRNTSLFLPPLPEQQQIAAFLDRKTAELDAVLRLKERQLELLAEKRQALISQAVTHGIDPTAPLKPSGIPWLGDVPKHWEVVPLKFLSVKIGSGKTPRSGAESYVSSGIIFLRSQNVYDDGLRLDDVAFITDEVDEEMSNTRVVAGDLLLNITGASIGRTCIVPPNFPGANVNQHVCIIRLKQGLVAEFVAYFLKSSLLKQQILSFENGSSREGLNFEQVGSLLVSLPEASMPEQAATVAYLDRETARMDGIAQAIRAQIEKVREYRQALLSAAVTGKIDVRNEEKHPA